MMKKNIVVAAMLIAVPQLSMAESSVSLGLVQLKPDTTSSTESNSTLATTLGVNGGFAISESFSVSGNANITTASSHQSGAVDDTYDSSQSLDVDLIYHLNDSVDLLLGYSNVSIERLENDNGTGITKAKVGQNGFGFGAAFAMSESSSLSLGYDYLNNSSFTRNTAGEGEYVKKITSYSLDYKVLLSESSKLSLGYTSYDAPDYVDNNADGTTYDRTETYSGNSSYIAYTMTFGSVDITPFYIGLSHKEDSSGTIDKDNSTAYGIVFSGGLGDVNYASQARDHWVGLFNAQHLH